jgi:hypothetical protein
VYDQISDIQKYARHAGCTANYSPGLFLLIYIISNLIAWRASEPYWLLSLFIVLPIAVVQDVLNSYWKKEQPGLKERTNFSWRQIILLIIGVLLWVLVIIGMSIPE